MESTQSTTKKQNPGLSHGTKPANGAARAMPEKTQKFLMFLLGMEPAERNRCLLKKKLQLISAGARADNIPVKAEDQAKFLSRLTEPAMRHVREWFLENADFDGLPDAVEACRTLRANGSQEQLLDEGPKRLYRSVLCAYFQQRELTEIDEFLKESVKPLLVGPLPAQSEQASVPAEPRSSANLHESLNPRIGISAESNSEASGKTRANTPRHAKGLNEVELESSAERTVIGRITKELPNGQFFIHIEGILTDGEIVQLTKEEAREVFPETGDATAFPRTVQLTQSTAHSLSVWRVDHRSPDKPTQFVVTEFVSHTYELITVPHASSEPDEVRLWIQEAYTSSPHVLPVFQLADGLLVKLPHDTAEPQTFDFDLPLNGYRNLAAVRWQGRTIIVEKLPPAHFKYDCATLRTTAKRLLQTKSELSGVKPATKATASEIADALAKHSDPALAQSARRIKAHLVELFTSEEVLGSLIEDILRLPTVQKAIEQEKQRVGELVRVEASASNAELRKFEAEKNRLLDEIANLKQSRKKEAANVTREIKLAFEQASKEGLKTLANISLFQAAFELAESKPAVSMRPSEPAVTTAAEYSVSNDMAPHILPSAAAEVIADAKGLAAAMAKLYWNNGLSTLMLQASLAAAASGCAIGLLGARRDAAAAAIAGITAGGTACTVSVTGDMFGLSDLMNAPALASHPEGTIALTFGNFILARQAAGQPILVRLKGVNRVPPEAMLPELLEASGAGKSGTALTWTARDGTLLQTALTVPLITLVDFVQGRSVFPFAPEIAGQIALIDTDAPWGDCQAPTPGCPSPRSVLDQEFFRKLAEKPKELHPAALACMPEDAAANARRMKGGLSILALKPHETDLLPLLTYGIGRQNGDKLAGALAAIDIDCAVKYKNYVENTKTNYLFDMEKDA